MKLELISGTQEQPKIVAFFCPACKMHHQVWINREERPHWNWNGSWDSPSFHPSVRVNMGGTPNKICHFNIVEGKIHYAGDCTHDLLGTVVDMVEIQ